MCREETFKAEAHACGCLKNEKGHGSSCAGTAAYHRMDVAAAAREHIGWLRHTTDGSRNSGRKPDARDFDMRAVRVQCKDLLGRYVTGLTALVCGRSTEAYSPVVFELQDMSCCSDKASSARRRVSLITNTDAQ
jgi:hypothetical protein